MEVIIIPFIDHSLFLHPWFCFPIDKSDEDELAFVESKKRKEVFSFFDEKNSLAGRSKYLLYVRLCINSYIV